jgi:hypothetical protein
MADDHGAPIKSVLAACQQARAKSKIISTEWSKIISAKRSSTGCEDIEDAQERHHHDQVRPADQQPVSEADGRQRQHCVVSDPASRLPTFVDPVKDAADLVLPDLRVQAILSLQRGGGLALARLTCLGLCRAAKAEGWVLRETSYSGTVTRTAGHQTTCHRRILPVNGFCCFHVVPLIGPPLATGGWRGATSWPKSSAARRRNT